jgi:predicted nucleic-acid-binding Zn-ribbon protein
METKKCPKCDGEMVNDKDLGSYGELTLKSKDQFLGDTVLTFYCVICGYIELYRARNENKGIKV